MPLENDASVKMVAKIWILQDLNPEQWFECGFCKICATLDFILAQQIKFFYRLLSISWLLKLF